MCVRTFLLRGKIDRRSECVRKLGVFSNVPNTPDFKMTSVMAFPPLGSLPPVAPSLAPSGGGGLDSSHQLALASELLALGAMAPPPPSFGHSMSTLGVQIPPPILLESVFTESSEWDEPLPAHQTAPQPAEPVAVAPQLLAVEQVWAALNERLTNEIADTAESRAYANLLLRDVVASPYTEDSMLHAPHQDLWVPRLDELRVTVQQWANMDELHALIQELETAFINMVAWLHTVPDPDAYYGQYSARLWTILA